MVVQAVWTGERTGRSLEKVLGERTSMEVVAAETVLPGPERRSMVTMAMATVLGNHINAEETELVPSLVGTVVWWPSIVVGLSTVPVAYSIFPEVMETLATRFPKTIYGVVVAVAHREEMVVTFLLEPRTLFKNLN